MEIEYFGRSGKSFSEEISPEMLYIIASISVPEDVTDLRFSESSAYLECWKEDSDPIEIHLSPSQKTELKAAVVDGVYFPTEKELEKFFNINEEETYAADLVTGQIYYTASDDIPNYLYQWEDSGFSLLED